MQVITAPDRPTSFEKPSIFLGGAITGAADWQAMAAGLLQNSFATCFNPRRPDGFTPPTHPQYLQNYREQVRWEHTYLLAADVVLFWMPKEALAITTRFEIGWWFGMNFISANTRPFAVGIEPGVQGETYYRVVLPDINVPVHTSLEATCAWASHRYSDLQKD